MRTLLSLAHVALTGRVTALYPGTPPALHASPITLPDFVTEQMRQVHALCGYEPALVGGTVNRLQFGKPVRDLDLIVLTPGNPTPVARAFRNQLDAQQMPHRKARLYSLVVNHVGTTLNGIDTDIMFFQGTRHDLPRLADLGDMDMTAAVISRGMLYETPRRIRAITNRQIGIGSLGLPELPFNARRVRRYRQTYPDWPVVYASRRDAFLFQILPRLLKETGRHTVQPFAPNP